eukprot:Rhum_TRINITY_DN14281_c3_g1::Rhum_TRINITY_DN14281_c3_g1_i1::g.76840::m.76840
MLLHHATLSVLLRQTAPGHHRGPVLVHHHLRLRLEAGGRRVPVGTNVRRRSSERHRLRLRVRRRCTHPRRGASKSTRTSPQALRRTPTDTASLLWNILPLPCSVWTSFARVVLSGPAWNAAAAAATTATVVPVDNLLLVVLPDVLLLGVADLQLLALELLAVHLGLRLAGVLGLHEAHEAEAFALLRLDVDHHLRRDDLSELLEALTELAARHGAVQVLDVQVGVLLVLGRPLLRVLPLHEIPLRLPLVAADIQLEALLGDTLLLRLVARLDEALRRLVLGEVDEGVAPRAAAVVAHDLQRLDGAVLGAEGLDLFVGQVLVEVLHVAVREALVQLLHLRLLALELAARHRQAVQVLALHLVHSLVRRLLRLEVHEAVAEARAAVVRRHLARQDRSEGGEDLVQRLVVHRLSKVLDKDVADTRLPQGGVTLAPHDPARLVKDLAEVESVQGTLGVEGVLVVHVGVAQRLAVGRISADADRQHGADLPEDVVQVRLRHTACEVTDIERRLLLHISPTTLVHPNCARNSESSMKYRYCS